jgi:hypothetical protein
MLLLPQGQTGEAQKPPQKATLFQKSEGTRYKCTFPESLKGHSACYYAVKPYSELPSSLKRRENETQILKLVAK